MGMNDFYANPHVGIIEPLGTNDLYLNPHVDVDETLQAEAREERRNAERARLVLRETAIEQLRLALKSCRNAKMYSHEIERLVDTIMDDLELKS